MKIKRICYIISTVIISLFFVFLAVTEFGKSYVRLGETFVDLWNSIKIYICEIFEIEHGIDPTVTEYSNVFKIDVSIPENIEKLEIEVGEYVELLGSEENIKSYGITLKDWLSKTSKILMIIFPVLMMGGTLIQTIYMTPNNNYGDDTAPLKLVKFIYKKAVFPIKKTIEDYMSFLRENERILELWVLIWLMNLNLVSIAIAFVSYYLYFAVTFDFTTIYRQIVKLSLDLSVFFDVIPVWCLIIVGYLCFDKYRKDLAQNILNHNEMKNRGFINSLPIVSMTCGSMGKKKTTLITDMALSQEVMFRAKAYELLKKNDMRFPHFPWICFELDLRRAMEYGEVYNLATVKTWINKKRCRFEKHGDPKKRLYSYDIDRYGDSYYDGLEKYSLFDVLSLYSQLYFIYVIESSLIVSNYSIRTDNMLIDKGNFPVWISDFFPEDSDGYARYAHILDFDVLRLGKKVIENNPNTGSFEFGIIVISEVGKERGNILDHKELKRNQDETNQKNDLFNSWLKMCRHSATVDNFPFIKVFTDEQRPESWGADARDLCDIVHIVTSGPQRIALPFYTIEEMIAEHSFNLFINLYYKMRFIRGDTTLAIHILKIICAALYRRNIELYNKYGYSISYIEKERGTMDGKIEKKRYYLMNKKIYSNRFSTDCFSDYFNEMAKKTKIGLNDYIEYETERATVEELKMQNSYFINALYKNAGSN